MKKKILDLLYKSLDSELTARENQELNRALLESQELRDEKQKIAKTREAIYKTKAKSFKPFFAERVINEMRARRSNQNQAESFFNSLLIVFRPVAIAAVIILISLLSYNLKKTGNYSIAGALGESKTTLEEIVDPVYMLTME